MGQVQVADDVVATNSITRTWRDKAQIIYTENTTNDTFSHPRFILAGPESSNVQVAEFFTAPNNARITDFEILEDTVYFCGYIRDFHRPDVRFPEYASSMGNGFVGYFCIPELFSGQDSMHTLVFKPYNTAGRNLKLDIPLNLEVIKVHDGIHIVCVGKYSTNAPGDDGSKRHFLADIAHSFADSNWWYYVVFDNQFEQFTDIAVTDHYIVTTAHKVNSGGLFMRIFHKPTQALYTPLLPVRCNIFSTIGGESPLYKDMYTWRDGFRHYYSRITHTMGDCVAVASLTDSIMSDFTGVFGASVKHIDLDALINWKIADERARNYYLRNTTSILPTTASAPASISMMNEDAMTWDAEEHPGNWSPVIAPIDSTHNTGTNTNFLKYSAMINQNFNECDTHTWFLSLIKEVKYDIEKGLVLLVQDTAYSTPRYDTAISAIYGFNISSDTQPVTRYSRPHRPIFSVDPQFYNNINTMWMSGADNSSPDRKLEFGDNSCVQASQIETIPLKGMMGFCERSISPWYAWASNAFLVQTFPATLSDAKAKSACDW